MSQTKTQPPTADAPLDALLERVGPVIAQTVDALQVAALLEADGITDAIAQDRYGFPDVFRLAAEVRRRTVPGSDPAVPRQASRRPAGHRWGAVAVPDDGETGRLVSHGLLYLLPAAIFPPVLAFLSARSLILGLVVGAGVAWVWAGAATWLAYRLLADQRPGAAAQVLRVAALSGPPVAFGLGLVLAQPAGGGISLAVVAFVQMAYQMGATLLMFHHREKVLLLMMLPVVLFGGLYLLTTGDTVSTVALLVAAACTGAVFWFAVVTTGTHASPAATAARRVVTREPDQLVLVTLYTALTAAYLLHAQSRYLFGSLEETLQVAVGLLPLIAAMGVVELRAHRFVFRARALMGRVTYPRDFARGVRWIVARDLAVASGAVLGLGAVLVAVLTVLGALTPAGVLMIVAGAFLAGAYYVSFLLSGMARLGPLCVAVGLALLVHVVVLSLIPGTPDPLLDIAVFTGTSLMLLVVSLSFLLPAVAEPRTHA